MLRKSYHMKMDKKLLELYSDYIISSFGQITATGLSRVLSGVISHDKITRFLSEKDLDSKQLWKLVKPVVREYEQEEGVVIIDDTIENKPHTQESEVVCWHHDHQSNQSVKGINLINYVYSVGDISLPVSFDVVKKPIEFCEVKTKKEKRKATVTKNELIRNQLNICQKNQLKYKYVLADSWFSSKENMTFIRQDLDKHFVMALKSNRTVALSEQDKQQGAFIRIDSLDWSKQESVRGWLKGLDFPVLIHRQVFTNKDGSTGILYLACSDLNCNVSQIEAIYKKRWKVEVFHKTLKSNTGLAKSPTKCIRTQSNHIFMSIYAAFQLECLKLKHKMNHFALRNRIYLQALQQAMSELHLLKTA
jgi:SRSO17 transposase